MPALTTPGASWLTVYSTERLLSGYSGDLALLSNTNGGAPGTYTPAGSGKTGLTPSDVTPAASVLALNDQVGSAFSLNQGALVNRPRMRGEVVANTRVALAFAGTPNSGGAHINLASTGQALTLNNRTEVFVLKPNYVDRPQSYSQHRNSGGTEVDNLLTGTANDGILMVGANNSGLRMRSNLQVLVVVKASTGSAVFYNGVKTSLSAEAATAIASVSVGARVGAETHNANMRLCAYASMAQAVNDTDAQAISSALMARFGIDPNFTHNIVHVGDSIAAGVYATDTMDLQHYMLPGIKANIQYFNLAIPGQTLATSYAARTQNEGALLVSGKKNIVLLDEGINDLGAGTTGANLYANTLAPYVSYLKGLGYKVGVSTILPQSANGVGTGYAASDAAVESERNAYNALVRANSAGADFITDRAADPTMGVYQTSTNNSALFYDKLHPTTLGYSYLGPIYSTAINANLS